MAGPGALESVGELARQELEIAPGLRHVEVFTMRGLLTVLVHEPAGDVQRGAIVACGGAMGGLLGPGRGLYHELGQRWGRAGVPVLRVGYRRPNDLDQCAHDVACAVEMALAMGVEQVVVMGHSFGGAVAVRVAVVMPEVAGVVTFATQSAGCEVAGGLLGRPLLLFHGDRDELLPMQASEVVAAIAGHGDVVVLCGDGHLLGRSTDVIHERLGEWLPAVLGVRSRG
jgi:hypothetical protein